MATVPDDITPGQLVTAETMQKWSDAIKEMQTTLAGNGSWITLPLYAVNNWGSVHADIPRPKYRRFGGMIQFMGGAYSPGTFPAATGYRLTTAIPDLISAMPTDPADFLQYPIGTNRLKNGVVAQVQMQPGANGLVIMPNIDVSGMAVILDGVQFADFAAR